MFLNSKSVNAINTKVFHNPQKIPVNESSFNNDSFTVIFNGIFYSEATLNLWSKSNGCFHIVIVLANTPQNSNHVGQTPFSDYDLIN